MDLLQTRILKQGAALLALTLGTAAWGQAANYPQGAIVQSLEAGPGDDLSRYLSELNSAPRSLSALLGAAHAALELGDVQGALTFFGRAEEVAPRDGRVKAGMGAAFAASEDPQTAFRYFAEAQSLGVSVAEFAGDRGLAYDMVGDPVRAQADYTLALQHERDPEVERRMALSRAISGDKAGALAILEPQIQKQDRAGWRTRAFVLALTGDAAGAASVAQTMMPGNQSAAMRPFLDRLASLRPAEKAMAVHFGRFPSDGRPSSYAAASVPPQAYVPAQTRQAAKIEPMPRASYGPSYRGVAEPQQQASTTSPPQTARLTAGPIRSLALKPSAAVDTEAPQTVAPATPEATPKLAPAPKPVKVDPPQLAFADVVDAVQSLPGAAPAEAGPTTAKPAQKKAEPKPAPVKTAAAKPVDKKTEAKPAAEKKPDAKPFADKKAANTKAVAKKAEPPKPKETARIWVQVAAGANKSVLPAEYKKIQAKAPKLLSGKSAWTAPLGASNRLLVGPFKTDTEARALVNDLAKLKLGSYPWKSEDGDKVEKVGAK